jgi:hypothetical protein
MPFAPTVKNDSDVLSIFAAITPLVTEIPLPAVYSSTKPFKSISVVVSVLSTVYQVNVIVLVLASYEAPFKT